MMTMILLVQSNVAFSQTSGTATVITPTGGFGIDGNLEADNGVGDWLQNNNPQGGFVLYDDATPVNPIMTFHLEDAYAPFVDDVFKGGKIYDNPNNMQWENQQANGKSDMNHGFLHLTKDVNGNEWAIFSSDRKTATGVSYLDFEFLQKPISQNTNGTFTSLGTQGGRTVGDFVVSATFGNGTTTFQVWTWQQTSPGVFTYVPYTGSLNGIAYAAENLTSLNVPHLAFGQPTYVANTFVEGAMNISQFIGAALPCTNTQIFTLFIKTKTSPSIEATIQDFITPIQIYSLTIGSANAGSDQTLCDEGDYTTFTLNGQAIPITGTEVYSTTWSVVSFTGTQAPVIANPSSLNSTVNVYDGTATLRLTVVTTINGVDFCTVSDDVVLNISPKPAPTWVNPPANITISCADASSIAPTYLSYSNNVTGQCNLSGSVLGVISGTYDECGGVLTQTWTYNYPPSGVITYTQTITVLPAPQAQFATISPVTITCNEATTYAASNLSYSNAGSGGCLIQGQVIGSLTASYDECGGTITQNWTYTDECGRTSTQTQIITVLPAPQAQFATVLPVTITCNEATTYAASNLTYSNAGSGGCLIQGQVIGSLSANYDECGGTITQNWTYTDECGRTSTQTQTITVSPAPQAQFAAVEPVTITCNEAITFSASNLSYSNAGSGGCLIQGQVMGSLTPNYTECGGTITQNWTYTDECGRTSTQTQTITVLPAPQEQFAAVSPVTITCNEATTFAASNLSYSNAGSGGCLIQGQVMGSLTANYDECGGTITQNWTYTDECGRTSTQTQTITVSPAPMAAFINPPANTTITCDAATTFVATNLSYTNAGSGGCLIAGQVLGVITGTYDECGGTLYETWTFADDCGRQIQHVQTITVSPAPMAAFINPPANTTITCDAATTFTATNLSYTNAGLGGCLITGQVLGVITGTYDECGGTLYETWTFVDDCGRQIQHVQTITVSPAPMAAFINPPVNTTITCDAATTFAATNLSYTNAGSGGCLITGQVLGVITGTYDECGGTLYETWTFVDDCGRQIQHVQTITVSPAPMAAFTNPPANTTITCDAATTFAATNLSYTNAGLVGCLISGQVLGVITGTYDECGGTLYETWTFLDDCGRQIQHVQTITVLPAPMAAFTNPPANTTITCDAATTFAATNLSYTNAGLGGCLITGQVLGVITGTYDECGGTLYETWTFVDDCGRQIQHVQTITVSPAPQAQFAAVEPVTITCDQATTYAPSYLGYTNSGLGGCLIQGQVMGVLTPDYTECGGIITQSWSFTDDCGRISTQTQIITVLPAPQAQFAAVEPVTITCDQATTYAPSYLGYTNAGLGGCLIQGQDLGELTPNYTECGGTITQFWSFTDDCGRISTQTQIITVLPAPQAAFVNPPAEITITCDAATTFAATNLGYTNSGLGGCLIEGEVPGVISGTYTECGGTLYQTWTFEDDCDRVITYTQTINVSPAPVAAFVNPPAEITITCDAATTFAASNLGYTNSGLGGCLIEGEVLGVVTGTYTECGGTLFQTWTFEDDCDRVITYTQTINVSPAPVAAFVNPPAETTITCDAATTFAASSLGYTNSGLGGCLIEGEVPGVISGTYTECGGTLYQTWTFTDDCQRVITYTQTIHVSPAPQAVFVNPPADITITCGEATSFAVSSLSYSNAGLGGCLISGQVNGVLSGSYTECGGTMYQTWTFTDLCNRTTTFVQTINVTAAPQAQFAAVENYSISCENAASLQPSYLAYTNNAVNGCLIAGQVLGVITGNYNNCNGVLTQTWTFTDNCGRTSTQTQTINIYDNTAPTFTAPANTTIYTDVNCNYNASVSVTGDVTNEADNCSVNLQATYTDVVSDGICEGSHTIYRTWSLVDDCGNAAPTQLQVITVQDNMAPVVITVAGSLDATVECSDPEGLAAALALAPTADDNCSSELTLNLVSDVTTNSQQCDNEYTRVRTWNFTDDCGNVSENFVQTINVVDNTNPLWTVLPTDLTVECDGQGNTSQLNAWLNTPAGTDNCGIASVTNNYTTLSNGCGNTGSALVTFTLTDECGNAVTATATFSIVDTENPTINVPANLEVDTDPGVCGAQITLIATGGDDCGEVTITNDLTGSANASGFYNAGVTIIQWTATDECGNTVTAQTMITVIDEEPPMIICPPHITVNADDKECGAYVEVPAPIVSDNCEIRTVTNTFTGTDDASAFYPIGTTIVWWTVVDMDGNTDNCFMNVTVNDNQGPSIVCPENISVSNDPGECGAYVTVPAPEAEDNCPGITVVNSFNGTADASGTYPVGTTTITWTVTDANGHTAECTMTVTVNDTESPIIICPGDIATTTDAGVCGAEVTVPQPEASDNCGVDQMTNDFTGSANASGFYPVGTTTVTWTVTDAHGNTAICQMNVVVTDNENPTIICPENMTVSATGENCTANVTIPEPTGADNCGVAFYTNSINGTGNASGVYELGTTEITWTVTDIHGNEATCVMTVTVIDDVNPEITCVGEVSAVAGENCMAQVTIPEPQVSDNCGGITVINSFNNSGNASGNYPVGVTVVTWTVTDNHGNVATCVTTVTVSAPPVAVDDNATTNINTAVTVTVLANDTDCANDIVPSTVVTVTGPANGTVVVNTDGTVTYTPNNNYTGTDTFTYRVCDEEGLCDEAVVNITISGEVLTMTAVDDSYTTLEGNPVVITNLANDIYPAVVEPVVTLLTPPSNGNLIINSDMTAVYTPNPGFVGTDTYTYTLSDANNLVASVTALTTIVVTPNEQRDIVIYNIITPDGDGRNDRWLIDYIDEYPDNEVLIFNRWGDQLHYFEGYDNSTVVWDGTNRAGDKLPAGTYYYIIKLRDVKKVYTGWVVIHAKK